MKNEKLIISKKIISFLLVIAVISGCASNESSMQKNETWDDFTQYNDEGYKVSYFKESDEAFTNPMKGFRPAVYLGGNYFEPHEYGSVYKHYIKYTELEQTESDTVQKIIDWSNNAWEGFEKKNIKVIPRVVLTMPTTNQQGAKTDDYWPIDIPQGSFVSRWTSLELEKRLSGFVKKLGEAWDNDPRVAGVELGLWGYWGEHHLLYDGGRIPLSMQIVLGDAFSSAFKNKKVMVRYPETFKDYQFGFYWDSFALTDDSESGYGIIGRNVWKTQMISGEVAYDWGNRAQLGKTPDETVANKRRTDFLIDWIKKTHATSLGWVSDYNQNDQKKRENAARIQKALGYRFVIDSVIYKQTLAADEELKLGFKVSNVGSAPFYYQWPVEISLLDKNHNSVFRKIIETDIRSWLPGETSTIHTTITLPPELSGDTYIIAFSILDPAADKPALRFANHNYYNGGLTPVGTIGFGIEPEHIDWGKFDLLKNDNSLGYDR